MTAASPRSWPATRQYPKYSQDIPFGRGMIRHADHQVANQITTAGTRAGSASDASWASRAPRIAGDVAAGSAFTCCRAGGLRPVRGEPRF